MPNTLNYNKKITNTDLDLETGYIIESRRIGLLLLRYNQFSDKLFDNIWHSNEIQQVGRNLHLAEKNYTNLVMIVLQTQ